MMMVHLITSCVVGLQPAPATDATMSWSFESPEEIRLWAFDVTGDAKRRMPQPKVEGGRLTLLESWMKSSAAVILDPGRPIPGLNDSKKLGEKKRDALAVLIRERALAWAVAEATVEEIDRLNILHATMLAMQRAVAGLAVTPVAALVDGNR